MPPSSNGGLNDTQQFVIKMVLDRIEDIQHSANEHHHAQQRALQDLKEHGLPMCKIQAQKIDAIMAKLDSRKPLTLKELSQRLAIISTAIVTVVGTITGISFVNPSKASPSPVTSSSYGSPTNAPVARQP